MDLKNASCRRDFPPSAVPLARLQGLALRFLAPKLCSFECYSPLQDVISEVGPDAECGSLGRYLPLQDVISGVRNDAKWGSLRRYSPLQDAISGVGKDAGCGSSGRYSSLQDAMWGSEMTPSGFTLTGSERTSKVALRDATHHYKTRLWGSEMTPDGITSRWLHWAGWAGWLGWLGWLAGS